MPIPGIPKGLRRQVKECFVAALETNPLLANRRAVKTWLTWDGRDPVAEPTVDQLPACQVRLIGGTVERKATTRAPGTPMSYFNESRITVVIDLWTAGTDAGDLMDLGDLIVRALAPQDPDARTALNERFRINGIKDCQLIKELLPSSGESYTLASVSGQGAYVLTVQSFS
jgi:hypothetical protein